MKLIKKLIVSAFWEKDGVTGLEDGLETAGVIGRDILGEGITWGVFEDPGHYIYNSHLSFSEFD